MVDQASQIVTDTIPLFPLRTVLFPGGPLPLRVFEPRYLDMVSSCMKTETQFGVMLIRDGSEVGEARLMEVGTRARITDWYQGSDGILGVTAMGTERFTLQRAERQADGLYLGTVTALPADPPAPLPEDYRSLASLLEAVIEDLGKLYEPVPKHYDDAGWVAARFAEILPIELEQKQQCLEMEDPIERLEFIRPLLRSIRQEPSQ